VKSIVLPTENEKDLADIPKNVLDVMNVYMVETMDEVLKVALADALPAPITSATTPAAVVEDVDDATTH
jgi:ATP-dependent Lon protease